jgi:hypothetical protein
MLDTTSTARCTYRGCSRGGEIAALIIEVVGGRLERRVCDRHISMVPTITREHQGLAYHLIPFQWEPTNRSTLHKAPQPSGRSAGSGGASRSSVIVR